MNLNIYKLILLSMTTMIFLAACGVNVDTDAVEKNAVKYSMRADHQLSLKLDIGDLVEAIHQREKEEAEDNEHEEVEEDTSDDESTTGQASESGGTGLPNSEEKTESGTDSSSNGSSGSESSNSTNNDTDKESDEESNNNSGSTSSGNSNSDSKNSKSGDTTESNPDSNDSGESSSSEGQFEQQVLSLVNDIRKENGLSAFKTDSNLSKVARIKSEDMRDNNYMAHDSPTYGSPFDMMNHYDINYTWAGENIAAGQRSAEEVVDGWMNSEGHRANILNENFTHMGVGYASGGEWRHYWTQLFVSY